MSQQRHMDIVKLRSRVRFMQSKQRFMTQLIGKRGMYGSRQGNREYGAPEAAPAEAAVQTATAEAAPAAVQTATAEGAAPAPGF